VIKLFFTTTLFLIIFGATVYAVMYFQKQSTDDVTDIGTKFRLERSCPDEWYHNRMPTIQGTVEEDQYFVADGERRELKEYDVDWVRANCAIEVQEVY
jgi:hypothetical protein